MLNRGKYGHSLDGSVLRLSLLRAAYFPDPLPDVGRHEIEWSLQPHAGACDIATLARAGLAYNVPFETFQLRQQPGTLDTRYSLLAAEGSSNFLVTAVKHSEDGRALIIRGYDANGTGGNGALAGALKARSASRVNTLEDAMDGEVRVAANGRIETTMRPWEIVAIKVPFPNHLRLESSANQRGRRKP
jgi:alpha-mannosidase